MQRGDRRNDFNNVSGRPERGKMKRNMKDCDQIPQTRDCGKCKVKPCRTLGKGIAGLTGRYIEEAITHKRPVDMVGLQADIDAQFPGLPVGQESKLQWRDHEDNQDRG